MNNASNQLPLRVVLYPKDVENITGRGSRTARRLLQKIKTACGKSRNEFVTIHEFSHFTGIPHQLIEDFLRF